MPSRSMTRVAPVPFPGQTPSPSGGVSKYRKVGSNAMTQYSLFSAAVHHSLTLCVSALFCEGYRHPQLTMAVACRPILAVPAYRLVIASSIITLLLSLDVTASRLRGVSFNKWQVVRAREAVLQQLPFSRLSMIKSKLCPHYNSGYCIAGAHGSEWRGRRELPRQVYYE